jgi:NF-kappa-B inhibitor-like protein 1
MSSSSSFSSEDNTRRASRRFLRAAKNGDLRKAKKRWKRCAGLSLECRVASRRGLPDAGRTAMHLACASGNEDFIRWLIKKGADVTVVDDNGVTPAHLLARWASARKSALLRLKKAGADFGAADGTGATPDEIAKHAMEESVRVRAEYAETRARRRRNHDESDDGYEGLGDVSGRRKAAEENAWRRKLLAGAEADAGGDTLFTETGVGTYEEDTPFAMGDQWLGTSTQSFANFFSSFAEDDEQTFGEVAFDARAYFREEESAYRSYKAHAGASAAEPRQSATQRRDADAQRKLDELRREDAAWRENVASGAGRKRGRIEKEQKSVSTLLDAQGYRARWGRVAAMADRHEPIAFEDVPWPMGDETEVSADEVLKILVGVSVEQQKLTHRAVLRLEMLRWHPDKFESKVGCFVHQNDRDRVRAKVNEVARIVQELFQRTSQ